MATEISVVGAQAREGLNLANVLHQTLGTAVILIDEPRTTATLISGADPLSVFQGTQRQVSLDVLPHSLLGVAKEAAASGKSVGARTLKLPCGEREGLFCVTALPLEPPGGTPPRVAVVLNDLSSVERFEDRVLQLDRLASLGTLAAGMAHEVKNALVACKTFIDLLLEKHRDAELVEIVRREMARIDIIVSRTLKFAGDNSRDFRAVHAHDVLEHCLRMIERQMEDRAILLTRTFDATPDLVHGDEHELQQAFVNLFLNAVEAMGPKGSLTVTTRLLPAHRQAAAKAEGEPARICVTIQDSGAGIPDEVMEHLFEPFITTKANGTGLGLAITQRIIHQHRGTISARSTSGQGTVFTVTLPALNVVRGA